MTTPPARRRRHTMVALPLLLLAAFLVSSLAMAPAAQAGNGCRSATARGCTPPPTKCGAGQHSDGDGGCIDNVTCGEGQHLEGDTCVADPVECGPGTHAADGGCVPDDPCAKGPDPCGTPDQCATGTHLDGGVCVADVGTGQPCVSGMPSDGECLDTQGDGPAAAAGTPTAVAGVAAAPTSGGGAAAAPTARRAAAATAVGARRHLPYTGASVSDVLLLGGGLVLAGLGLSVTGRRRARRAISVQG